MVQLIIPWEFLALSIQDSEEGFPFETILEALSKFKLRSASTNHPNSKFLTTTQVTPSRKVYHIHQRERKKTSNQITL